MVIQNPINPIFITIFNNYSLVSLIIGMFLGNKYNEISIDFIY